MWCVNISKQIHLINGTASPNSYHPAHRLRLVRFFLDPKYDTNLKTFQLDIPTLKKSQLCVVILFLKASCGSEHTQSQEEYNGLKKISNNDIIIWLSVRFRKKTTHAANYRVCQRHNHEGFTFVKNQIENF